MSKQRPPAGAPVIDTKYCRESKTFISVVSLTHPDSVWRPSAEAPEHKFAAACIDHDFAETTKTRREATVISSHPSRWCPDCKRAAKKPQRNGKPVPQKVATK